jgi:hypothetical protein
MTTFTLQSLIFALKSLDKTGGTSVTAANLAFKLEQGFFLHLVDLLDNSTVTDNQVQAFFKSLSDSSSIAEALLFAVDKALADTPALTDFTSFSITKSGVSDGAAVSESHSRHLAKLVFDTINVTDDIDGAASILDDQEMQFFKTRTHIANVSDLHILNFGLGASDTTLITDAGLLRAQNYTPDFTYFAEDYVGVSRTL